jgi:hypothetical protein
VGATVCRQVAHCADGYGTPCEFDGTWHGLKLFGRIDEATFRKIVLALLFLSGVTLIL